MNSRNRCTPFTHPNPPPPLYTVDSLNIVCVVSRLPWLCSQNAIISVKPTQAFRSSFARLRAVQAIGKVEQSAFSDQTPLIVLLSSEKYSEAEIPVSGTDNLRRFQLSICTFFFFIVSVVDIFHLNIFVGISFRYPITRNSLSMLY